MIFHQMYGTGYEVIFVAFSGIVLAQIVKCFTLDCEEKS